MEKLAEQTQQIAQEVFNSGAKAVFADNPIIESFAWTQYTPYFNDGEPCIFSVKRDYNIYVNGEPFEVWKDSVVAWDDGPFSDKINDKDESAVTAVKAVA